VTPPFDIRSATASDAVELAELIHVSTNRWYATHGMGDIFSGDPLSTTSLFFEVYESLDPGRCLVAVDEDSGRLKGSCFYHPRDTHHSLGIMNVHPNYYGQGVASTLLETICRRADETAHPLRLVSSALNLDSFSLYTRAGFVPRALYQDMLIEDVSSIPPVKGSVRPATLSDLPGIVSLEMSVSGIRREGDWRYFLTDDHGWRVVVADGPEGLVGVLASIDHPGSRLLGPGVMVDPDSAKVLIADQLHAERSGSPVFLVPANCTSLVETLYGWGARNCELHVAQCRGEWVEPQGVVMPTFMPETG
jgi:GNAT superfamily N-acetyltransferase